MPHLSFYFDYRSPYAYLAHTQLRKLGADIAYRPFEILGLMEKVGNVPTSVTCKPKSRYVMTDLRRWVAHYGVPFERNPQMSGVDPKRLLRATLWAADQGQAGEVVTALYDAMWGSPRPLATPSDVADVLGSVGVSGANLETAMDDPAWDGALERATNEAVERGVFGAPCMFVGDQMFFGADRLDFVRAELERAT